MLVHQRVLIQVHLLLDVILPQGNNLKVLPIYRVILSNFFLGINDEVWPMGTTINPPATAMGHSYSPMTIGDGWLQASVLRIAQETTSRACGKSCRTLIWNSRWKPAMWPASAMCRTTFFLEIERRSETAQGKWRHWKTSSIFHPMWVCLKITPKSITVNHCVIIFPYFPHSKRSFWGVHGTPSQNLSDPFFEGWVCLKIWYIPNEIAI